MFKIVGIKAKLRIETNMEIVMFPNPHPDANSYAARYSFSLNCFIFLILYIIQVFILFII